MVRTTDETQYLDPVFLKAGQKVYTYDFIENLREENVQKKAQGKNNARRRVFRKKCFCPMPTSAS